MARRSTRKRHAKHFGEDWCEPDEVGGGVVLSVPHGSHVPWNRLNTYLYPPWYGVLGDPDQIHSLPIHNNLNAQIRSIYTNRVIFLVFSA